MADCEQESVLHNVNDKHRRDKSLCGIYFAHTTNAVLENGWKYRYNMNAGQGRKNKYLL